MNFCKTHWDELKTALTDRGLEPFFARDGKEAAAHMNRELNGEQTIMDFEPLLGSSQCIFTLAMNIGGMSCMKPVNEERPPCPVCFLNTFDYITAVADGALAEAQEKGLVEPAPA